MLRHETDDDPDFAMRGDRTLQEILQDDCLSKLNNGKQVRPASAKPGNVQVLEVRQSDWGLARE